MTNQHPIQPSPELVGQCMEMFKSGTRMEAMCGIAAQWGADQELNECCEHIRNYQWGFVDLPDGTKMHRAVHLELARRPKPLTLKEQALKILAAAGGPDFPQQMTVLNTDQHIIIKRALEALHDDIK